MIYGPNDPLPDLPLDPPDDERLTAEELQELRQEDAERREVTSDDSDERP